MQTPHFIVLKGILSLAKQLQLLIKLLLFSLYRISNCHIQVQIVLKVIDVVYVDVLIDETLFGEEEWCDGKG
jgi:hypothetical protein